MNFHTMILRYWKSIAIGVFIYVLCLIPSSELQKLDVLEIRFTDLVVHLLMFLVFSAVLSHDLKKSAGKTHALKSPLSLALGISLTLALTTEMLQFLLASLNRNANLIDLIFDTLGSVAGILLAKFIMQRYDSDS